ncbi:MAG: hypothetical protein M0Z40_16670, partial [Actinomycetota bacterium]|nr:hypothetical protein [Actinomycetota bacterium]
MAKRPKRRRGEGSISYEAAADRWRAMLSWRDGEGRLHRATKRAPTREDAELALATLRLEHAQGAREEEDVVFGAWLEHWLAAVLPGLRISERTKADYRKHARALAPLASIPLRSLGVRDAEALLADLADKGYSRTICRLVRATLSRVLGDAERTDLVTRNVARRAPTGRGEGAQGAPHARPRRGGPSRRGALGREGRGAVALDAAPRASPGGGGSARVGGRGPGRWGAPRRAGT